ncbi:MAG: hypothetical protein F4058_06635 [Rhodothermaceae bacterium]|nr:hypothetical protein [Bacteroidota bacterium]MXY07885.1 hypothetical protein [Rhodothermaceae bacterium]MYF64033.1 hypothetical protein [Rhodothermaceae bacterium]MYI84998.1 hypothetical protein [Rhodothermaceae bacterium]
MKHSKPAPDSDLSRIRAEFDQKMNPPSSNPHYGGLAPVEALQRSAKVAPKQDSKKTKSAV